MGYYFLLDAERADVAHLQADPMLHVLRHDAWGDNDCAELEPVSVRACPTGNWVSRRGSSCTTTASSRRRWSRCWMSRSRPCSSAAARSPIVQGQRDAAKRSASE